MNDNKLLSFAHGRYLSKKYEAEKNRGIEFNLTFDEWYIWWFIRGIDKNQKANKNMNKDTLCMARFGDVGPYSLDNIYAATISQNTKDFHKNKPSLLWVTPNGKFKNIDEAAYAERVHKSVIKFRVSNKESGYKRVRE